MDVIAVLLALVIGGVLGSAATQARLWVRRYNLKTGEAALQRRKVEFEARRVEWARRESRPELTVV